MANIIAKNVSFQRMEPSVSIDSSLSPSGPAPTAPGAATAGIDRCIVKRPDGVFADPTVLATTFAAAIDGVFATNNYFSGLDYAVLIKTLYNVGPNLPRSLTGEAMIRFADDIVPFDPMRRQLYKAVKLGGGKAEYYFEPVVMTDPADPDGPGVPARLNVDEFVADMCCATRSSPARQNA